MGRLTRRSNDGIFLTCGFYGSYYWKQDPFYEVVDKLAHYEDLEEQGRLIELPCAVGDLVYMIKNMDSLVIPNPNKPPEIIQIIFGCRHIPLIGINVFLTKEEAEAKMEELKGE